MSAPSKTHIEFDTVAHARDAYFSGNGPADEVPAAEHEPPVCPVAAPIAAPPPRNVTRKELHTQMLRLEILLSLWRLEHGSLAGFWDAHPESIPLPAVAANFDSMPASLPTAQHPAPVTDQDYVSQVAMQLFGNRAA